MNPDGRPSAKEMLDHPFFKEDPKPKREEMFPTFPSKAGQEKRRKRATPNAPVRGDGGAKGAFKDVDFSGIFAGLEESYVRARDHVDMCKKPGDVEGTADSEADWRFMVDAMDWESV